MSYTARTILTVGVSILAAALLILIGILIGATTPGPMSGWMQNLPFTTSVAMTYPGWMGNGRGMMGRSNGSLLGRDLAVEN